MGYTSDDISAKDRGKAFLDGRKPVDPRAIGEWEAAARHFFPEEFGPSDLTQSAAPTGTVCIGVDLGGRDDATAIVATRPLADGVDVIGASTLPLKVKGDDRVGYHAAQFELLRGICRSYVDDGSRVLLAVDVTGQDAAADILRTVLAKELSSGVVSLVRVWFVGGDAHPKVVGSAGSNDQRVTMPKQHLVHHAQAVSQRQRGDGRPFARYKLDGQAAQKLTGQLAAFGRTVSARGYEHYDASRGHDDLVTAFMLSLHLAVAGEQMKIHNPARHPGRMASVVAVALDDIRMDRWSKRP